MGSRAVVENATGSACEQDIDYYPYGGVEEDYCPVVSQNYRFGKEHDAESGLENFEARYDASSIGRFMTPDDGSDQTVDDPQSWNLYAYVRNQPLRYVDPTGHGDQGATAAASSCAQEQGGGGHTTCNVDTSGTTTAQNNNNNQTQQKKGLWAVLTGTVAAGVARISPSAAHKLWEAANPGEKVPFDAVRGRFYDMAHNKALADGGTNAAGNLKPQEHAEHMAEHMENGDFARWGARARQAITDAAEKTGAAISGAASGAAEFFLVAPMPSILLHPNQTPGDPDDCHCT